MPEDKVEKAIDYITESICRFSPHGGAMHDKRTNTIIVSCAGKTVPLDDQFSIARYVRERYQIEVDFQED